MSNYQVTSSYTAANTHPVKIYRDLNLLQSMSVGKVLPRHVNLCPTNRCDLKCPWCSCSERDLRDELTERQLLRLIESMDLQGTRAVTVTGGGEPTLHPSINLLCDELNAAGMKIGLVTNGVQAKRLRPTSVRSLSWCRISFSDTRDWSRAFEQSLEYLKNEGCRGLAFSYVVTNDLNEKNLARTVRHAMCHDFTHVRVVDDILNPSPVGMERARVVVQEAGLLSDRVIFQPRSEYTRGARRCLISLLKPMVAPNGFIYPCCGCQYALADELSGFPARMRMGRVEDFDGIVAQQRHFDGSICDRCFYSGYNQALAALLDPVDHIEFV